MNKCKDKIVLITGASSGIGAACAEQFAAAGARLILTARRHDKLKALSAQLQEKYATQSLLLPLDICQQSDVQREIKDLPQEWQAIDVLINNAGLAAGKDSVQNAEISDWEAMINTNIKGLLYITHSVLPGMLKQQRGHIINISSVAGYQTYAGGSVYCATKAAVSQFSAGLKKDVHGTPLRVTEIAPGAVNTEFSLVRFNQNATKADATYEDMTPLAAKDIADAVVYCATRPAHVNVMQMLIYPTDQSSSDMIYRHKNKES